METQSETGVVPDSHRTPDSVSWTRSVRPRGIGFFFFLFFFSPCRKNMNTLPPNTSGLTLLDARLLPEPSDATSEFVPAGFSLL